MLVVTGEDSPLVDRLCRALEDAHVPHRRFAAAEAAEHGTLFQAAFEQHATAVVLVEPMARIGVSPPAASETLLDAALAATSAPGVGLLVLATARADDDPGLRRVKQRGVPYVVLRAAPLFDLAREHELGLGGETVLVPAEAAAAVAGALPAAVFAEAVVEAAGGGAPQGRVVELPALGAQALSAALERAGAKPRTASTVRARIGRWFGRSVARVSGAVVCVDGIGEPARHASVGEGALLSA
jgi:hypothetical protein